MAYKNFMETLTFKAETDMRTRQFHIVDLGANAHGANLAAANLGVGVVQNIPNSGEAATVALAGVTKYRAGGAVSVGERVTAAATGFGVTVTSGALPTKYIGWALTTVASGGVGTLLIEHSVTTSGVAN
jgi:hypothetical protein